MLKLVSSAGHVYAGETEAELVRALHEHSHAPAEDDGAYMRQVAERTVTQTGKPIRTGSPAEFLTDLIGLGLLQEVQ